MKIALLGPTGQLGWELQRALAPLGSLYLLGRSSRPSTSVQLSGDLAQPASLLATLKDLQPDVVVNAAAYTAVDKAESEPGLARIINAEAPGVIARWLAQTGGWLLHYSTDYVFDGSGQAARTEAAATGPLSVYGRTKLAGEEAIRESGCQHLIFRTSWVHSARGGNFARTMLRLAAERDRLSVVNDQVGAPTGADLLADISAHALRQAWREPSVSGTYHAVAAGETDWCSYARHVLARAQALGVPLRAGPDAVQGVPTSAYPTPARRPLNSRLDTSQLQGRFGLAMPDWRIGIDRLLDEILPSHRSAPTP